MKSHRFADDHDSCADCGVHGKLLRFLQRSRVGDRSVLPTPRFADSKGPNPDDCHEVAVWLVHAE